MFQKLSFKAIIFGFLAGLICAAVLDVLVGLLIPDPFLKEHLAHNYEHFSLTFWIAGLTSSTLACIPCGYITGRIAKHFKITNVITVAIAVVIMNLVGFIAMPQYPYPLWVKVIGVALIVPITYLGGLLAQQHNTNKR